MSEDWYRIYNAVLWTKAIGYQGERLFEAHRRNIAEEIPRRLQESGDPTLLERDRVKIEEYYFALTVRRSERWLTEAAQIDGSLHSCLIEGRATPA